MRYNQEIVDKHTEPPTILDMMAKCSAKPWVIFKYGVLDDHPGVESRLDGGVHIVKVQSILDSNTVRGTLYGDRGSRLYKLCLLYTSPSPRDRG